MEQDGKGLLPPVLGQDKHEPWRHAAGSSLKRLRGAECRWGPAAPWNGFFEEERCFMREMNASKVVVRLVDGTLMRGKTNIGNARRLSDFFNKTESLFHVFFDVSMEGQEGGVVFVNRNHIVWVKPDEERRQDDAESLLTLKIESGPSNE
jgi:hypothetical protein